ANSTWSVDVATNPSAPAGNYTLTATDAHGFSATAAFAIGTGTATSFLTTSPAALTLSLSNTISPTTQQITLTNPASTAATWTAAAVVNSGGSWLAVSPTSGSIPAGGSQTLNVTLSPFHMPPASYGGKIVVSPGSGTSGNPAQIAVSL